MFLQRQFYKFSRLRSQAFIDLEDKYGCHNYHPLPVVISKAQGLFVYDQEGKQYMDFLAAYSAVNQGHCHPKILQTLIEQASQLTLTSRAFHNNKLGLAEKYIAELFKYQKVLFMNTGVEAGESAIKFARRWAYNIKGVEENQARVLFMKGNFWGRTIAACASSDDPDRYRGFGPFNGLNFDLIDYDNIEQLEQAFKNTPNYAGVMLEPIQGERGIIIPRQGYLKKVRELCTKYKVLMIADEIQSGLGRAGQLLASDWDQVRPDMVLLGKALSGGFYPVSAVLCDDEIMLQIRPGEHGSTYGGNPLAMSLAQTSMEVLLEEEMIENSRVMGKKLLDGLKSLQSDYIQDVRGKGLMIGLEFKVSGNLPKKLAWNFCIAMAHKGLLAKPTHDNVIRLTPPLIVKDYEINRAITIIQETLFDLEHGNLNTKPLF